MSKPNNYFERFPAVERLLLGRKSRRIPVVRQLGPGECGAASLVMVLGYFGKVVSLDEVRKELRIGRDGATASSIVRAGQTYGLRGRGVRLEIGDLENLPTGAILHWEFHHYVVLERVRGKRVDILDPATGRRSLPLAAFQQAFTGVAIVFEPGEGFEPGGAGSRHLAGLAREIVQRKNLFARILSMSLLTQTLGSIMPLLMAILIDDVVPRRDYSLLLVLAAGFALFQAFSAFAGFVRAHLLIFLRTQMEVSFTLRFLDHLMNLPYSFFQQHASGDLMVRMGSNNTIRDILTSTVLSALVDATTAIVYLVILLIANRTLAFAVIVFAVARIILVSIIRWRQKLLLAESLENQAQSQTSQVEMLSGIETLKAMGLEHQAAEDWSNLFIDGLNISIRSSRLDTVFSLILNVLSTLSTLTLMFYGAYNVLNGALTLGTLMGFNAIAANFISPLDSLASGAMQLQMLDVYLERLNDVLATPTEQDSSAVEPCGKLRGSIALQGISFRYGGDGPNVIDNISFTAPPGSHIALTGRTGSGKSTLAKLMAGLYDPDQGRVLFDGRDFKWLERRSVRRQLGIVTQDAQLFSGSIRQNIALTDPAMGMDTVVYAASLACIHDEIMAMPMGYETHLTDRGLSVSGGQRQRLAIARALAANPAVLIMDEATSHLDTLTEKRINENIAALRCTRIVVAHRLSTIANSDMILVLDKGRVVEHGTHVELLRANGSYAMLAAGQQGSATRVGTTA